VTRNEILAAIRERAQQLRHAPSFRELNEKVKLTEGNVRKYFGGYAQALEACGMKRVKGKEPVGFEVLFTDWARAVRKLGKLPTVMEYQKNSGYSVRPLLSRCHTWGRVPAAMLAYAENERLGDEWADVLGIIRKSLARKSEEAKEIVYGPSGGPKFFPERPVYGPPMMQMALTHGPVNEMGVVYLFGMIAWQLGFVVTRMQTEFPDCEAMRRITEQKWQKVRIEFEYGSRNYQRHLHPLDGCDVIVCWIHNWPECPLEVVELSKVKFCVNCEGGGKQ